MCRYNILNGYVGDKAKYVGKIKTFFDPNAKKYVEPYIGGGSVYFSHPNGKYEKEWINDANPNIATLYKALIDEETRDATLESIYGINKDNNEVVAREQFNKAKKMLLPRGVKKIPKDRYVQIATNTFRAYTQSFNCAANSYSKQKSNEKYRAEVKRNVKNAMERLVTKPLVTNMDGINVINKVKKKPEVQLMVDWPYVGIYRKSSKLYGVEMAGLYEHIMGAIALRHSKAAVVMCDYRSQYENVPTIYDAILTGDEWHCYKIADTHKHCQVVEPGEKKQFAYEYIWTNRVPENAGRYMLLDDYKQKITFNEY